MQRESQREIRRIVIRQAHAARVGHIGSALSVADILVALYEDVLRPADPQDPDRDRFILSKGHAALALYAMLHMRGRLSAGDLDGYCADGSLLGVHPDHALAGVDFTTGSLGMGLPMGVGAALAARLQGSQRRVFVLMSDAECNEGAVWEAAMFAAHHRLANLVAIVDANGLQALGRTRDVLDLAPLAARWAAFGWDAVDVDGHDVRALSAALIPAANGPRIIVARTVLGRGVAFMEDNLRWHYWPLSDDEYGAALRGLED